MEPASSPSTTSHNLKISPAMTGHDEASPTVAKVSKQKASAMTASFMLVTDAPEEWCVIDKWDSDCGASQMIGPDSPLPRRNKSATPTTAASDAVGDVDAIGSSGAVGGSDDGVSTDTGSESVEAERADQGNKLAGCLDEMLAASQDDEKLDSDADDGGDDNNDGDITDPTSSGSIWPDSPTAGDFFGFNLKSTSGLAAFGMTGALIATSVFAARARSTYSF